MLISDTFFVLVDVGGGGEGEGGGGGEERERETTAFQNSDKSISNNIKLANSRCEHFNLRAFG